MRSFEQRRAEILRRSERRLQKRKQLRKGLVALCVPVVLCAGLFLTKLTGGSQPATMPVSGENMLSDVYVTTSQASTVEFREESCDTVAAEVTVFLDGTCCFTDSGESAGRIAVLLQQIQSQPEATASFDFSCDSVQCEEHKTYRIVLQDGEEQVFYWTGTSLVYSEAEAEYTLTAQQFAALEEYTGLS